MVASVLIIGFSLILLVYWFRYSCLLLLRNSTVDAEMFDQRFGFSAVREQLNAGASLDPLHQTLARDYRLLTYLIGHAAGLNLTRLEDRLLVIDYKVMQYYFRITKSAAPAQARRALTEMATILEVLAQRIRENAAAEAQA
jgi:hypothetical protein